MEAIREVHFGEISVLCSALSEVLQRMPSDERQLVHVFEKNELLGFAIQPFSGYSHVKKFQAFADFVRNLPQRQL